MPIKSLAAKKKTATAEKKTEPASIRKSAELETDASVDFPQEGEMVLPGHYAVRISAKPGLDVEINTGGDEWIPVRESVGFFWHDWWPAKPGRATLSVRVKAGKGRWKKVSDRVCTVVGN